MVARYEGFLSEAVGPTKTLVVGETMQVKNYDRYDWDMFDAEARRQRHETVFPNELERAYQLGAEIVARPW